jgi:hypothetical protein
MRISHRVVPNAITIVSNIIPARLSKTFANNKYTANKINVGITKNKKGIISGASRKLAVGKGRNERSLKRIE